MATEQDIALHPANRAAHLYLSGTNNETRRADQFFIVFNLYPIDDDFLQAKYSYLKEFRDRLHFLCHTAEGPKFQIQQDVMNQYNRKRVINRKVDYDPVSIRMYDTVDGLALKFAKLLYEFEFQNARLYSSRQQGPSVTTGSKSDNFQESVLTNENQFKKTHNFGMIAQKGHQHRLLKSIDLYQLQGKLYSKARMVHPRLSRMDMDQFDYASSAITNVSLAFQYENLMFDEVAVKMQGLPANVKTAFTESSGKYEDWVRSTATENTDAPADDGINSVIVEDGIAGSYKNNEVTADDGFATADNVQSSDMQKSVTSKFSLPTNNILNKVHQAVYRTTVTNQNTSSELKALNATLSSAQLTAERDKIIANGPTSNTLDAKAAHKENIAIYDQAIANKKTDEANNKSGTWT
tara:strand:- start:7888 stop:9111 length:1224 start_codon:yes stop_codon:yes gene_type:complete